MDTAPEHRLSSAYKAKDDAYFGNARRDWIDLLPVNHSLSVLELGCGNGATGALALSEGKCGSYIGVEMSERAADQARAVLTRVHIGNIEAMELPYKDDSFDLLVCGEVLEHLVNPQEALKQLVRLLKPGGRMFASVPNVSHWRVIAGLILGRFDYTDWGMMDRTHLRWFTPRTFRDLIEAAGVEVDLIAPIARSPFRRAIGSLPLGHLTWLQIDMHGHKATR